MWYGYIKYYSIFDMEEVLRHSGKIMIGESRVKVRKKENTNDFKDRPLALHKSQDLLMHYFGFNCWNSEIVSVIPIKALDI